MRVKKTAAKAFIPIEPKRLVADLINSIDGPMPAIGLISPRLFTFGKKSSKTLTQPPP